MGIACLALRPLQRTCLASRTIGVFSLQRLVRNSTSNFQLPQSQNLGLRFGISANRLNCYFRNVGLSQSKTLFASPTANALHYCNVVVASRKSSSVADELSSVDGSN